MGKNSIGNVEAKELICMTHEHELWGGGMWVGGGGQDRVKGGKWDNCNSVINKIFFKKIKAMGSHWMVLRRGS